MNTTDPDYFKWTQWIFLQLYNSFFDTDLNQARPISELMEALSEDAKERMDWQGRTFLQRLSLSFHHATGQQTPEIKAQARRKLVDDHRLAYVSEQPVWWCEALGTVLANEEVVDGKSEVGGHPVVRKPMRQWMLRITAYAGRLLQDLDTIDWSDSLKEMQRNWIGRSEGAEVDFAIAWHGGPNAKSMIRVFTTRPDTLFGATYMVLAPEHKLVDQITTPAQRAAIQAYQAEVAKKSDLERTELAKEKTGVFTGAYALNPVNGAQIPIWIADSARQLRYGRIMAVPAHDTATLSATSSSADRAGCARRSQRLAAVSWTTAHGELNRAEVPSPPAHARGEAENHRLLEAKVSASAPSSTIARLVVQPQPLLG